MTALSLIHRASCIARPLNAVCRGVDTTAQVSKLTSEWGLFPRTSLASTGCVVSAAQPLFGAA